MRHSASMGNVKVIRYLHSRRPIIHAVNAGTHWRINDTDFLYILCCYLKQAIEQTVDLLVTWRHDSYVTALLWNLT